MRSRPPTPRPARIAHAVGLAGLGVALLALPALATTVAGLAAAHRNGQTFLTWTEPAGSGWTYRVYASTSPIQSAADLAGATLVGAADDSSWCDRRLSHLRGTVFGWATDSLAAPLGPGTGLFVATAPATGSRWYAVTAQASGGAEDPTVVPGRNATGAVSEVLAAPRPVYQRIVSGDYGESCEVYALWVTDQPTPLFPAMGDRAGMAYDIGVVRGGVAPDNVLWVRAHGRGGNFLASLTGSGDPAEWRVSNDDYLPNDDVATFYYGYVTSYDPFATGNPLPTSGTVVDYTWQRVLYTTDWMIATFPVDPDRVYVRGGSMGGTFTLQYALHDPGRIAAACALVPKVDLADFSDSVLPPLVFAPMWGDPASTDLPTPEGIGVYERLRMAYLAGEHPARDEVPVVTFSGRNDVTVGWAEKIPFYAAMEANRRGGMLFWDSRTHTGTGEWEPMIDFGYLRRYRRSVSYPALTHCSLDDDPGDGSSASGAAVGQIGAYVEWDPVPVDLPGRWEVELSLRDLTQTGGVLAPPDSATVDVTPRRLQQFTVTPLATYDWSVERLADGAVTATGTVNADADGLVTVPGVTVYRSGTWLRIKVPGVEAVAPGSTSTGALALAPERQPVRGAAVLAVRWPRDGAGRVELFDTGGRRVRELFRGEAAAGIMRVPLDASALSPGLYFARASQGLARAVARAVVVR